MKHLISGLTKLTVASVLIVTLAACGGAEERKVKYLEKGKTYLSDKNYDKAKVEFKNVLQIDPKFAEAYYYMGLLEENKKELRKAVGNYKKAIELDPLQTEAKVKLAKIYVIAGIKELTAEATKLLTEVKQKDPDNIEAELVSSTIQYKAGEKKQAIKRLEALVKKDTNQIDAITLLSNIYVEEKNYKKAEVLLLEAAKNNRQSVPVRTELAELYANKLEKVDLAEKYLLEAQTLDPDNYFLDVALASFYSRTEQVAKAEKILRDGIVKKDDDLQRYIYMIELITLKSGLKRAEEELTAYVKNKPDLYELKFVQVKFYSKFGKRDKAKTILNQIILDKPYEIESVKAKNLLAKFLLEEGNRSEAKKYVDEVIAEYPDNNDALLISSKLALANLDAVSAINGLRTIVKNDPKNAEASLLLAQAHEINKESSLAENELKKAIEVNPVNDQVHVNYARYLGSKGRIDEAIEVVDKALSYFKNSYDLMDIKLKIVASQGKESEVIPLLDMMEKADEAKAEVNLIRGQYFLSKKKIPQAITQFEKAYKKSNSKFKPLQIIIKTYMSTNQPEKAISRLQKSLDENPDDAVANLLLGQVFAAQKKLSEARSKFKQASKATPGWLLPYSSLAASYIAEKNFDKAIAVYEGASTKLSSKVPAQMKIAAIYELKKDYPAAMKVYQDILSEDDGNMLAINNYVSLLLDFGSESDMPKALEMAKKLSKLQKPALQDTLGWAYAKTGDNLKAIEILKPIVEKAPKIAIFRYHLGYALYNQGDKSAAKSHLEIASSSEQAFYGKDKAKELLNAL